jgi:hypothetical protein
VALVWDIKRLRGFRISTIEQAYGRALRNLLEHLLVDPSRIMPPPFIKARVLAQGWLENEPAAKEEVADVLGRIDLDESSRSR